MPAYLPFIAVLVHIAVVSILWWFSWAPLILALVWTCAWISWQEPTPTKSSRHSDVAAFEKTSLGQALLYRSGWVPEAFPAWGGPVLAVLLLGPGLALAFTLRSPEWTSTVWWREALALTLTSPIAILCLGILLSTCLLIPVLLMLAVFVYVLTAIVVISKGFTPYLWVLGAPVIPALILYATDLARLLRRRLYERRRG